MIVKIKQELSKHAFGYFALGLVLLFGLILILDNAYYAFDSDDFAQYRPFMQKIMHSIKDGTFSFYNIFDNYGNDISALLYYLPLDIFSLFIFLLDYIMPFNFAFEIAEVSKVILGGLLFYKLLEKRGVSKQSTILGSLIFLISGGFTVFMIYPTYTSLFFYVPLTLYFLENIKERKYLFIFLSAALFLYNFYNTYLIIVNVFIANEILKFYDADVINKDYWKNRIKDVCPYIAYTLIGLLISSFVVLPSVSYILEYTSIDRGHINWFDKEHFLILFSTILFPIKGTEFLKIGNYIQTQASLFAGIFTAFLICSFFTDKEKRSRKLIISGILLSLLIVPIFSKILTGSSYYSRWFFLLNIVLNTFAIRELDKGEHKRKNLLFLILVLLSVSATAYMINDPNNNAYKGDMVFILLALGFLSFSLLALALLKIKDKKVFNACMLFDLLITFFAIFSAPAFNKNVSNNINYTVNDYNKIENFLNENNISKNDRIIYSNQKGSNVNGEYYSDYFIRRPRSFVSFVNKTNYEFFDATNSQFESSIWLNKMNEDNLITASLLNYDYFLINKDAMNFTFDNKFFTKKCENESFVLYENNYSFEGMIYYDTFNYSEGMHESNLINSINKLYLKNSNNKNIFNTEIVYEGNTKDLSYEKVNDTENKAYKLEIDIPYDDDYFYFLDIAENKTSFSTNGKGTERYGSMLRWTDKIILYSYVNNNLEPENIQLNKVSKQLVLDELKKQQAQNNIKVKYDNGHFNVTGTKKKGEEAYVTVPYTYSENFQSDYELINGNGGFLTIKLSKDVTDFNVNIDYNVNHNLSISLSFTGLLVALGIMCYFEINLRKKPKNNEIEPE